MKKNFFELSLTYSLVITDFFFVSLTNLISK